MSDVYSLPCLTCGHPIDDHDANECWEQVGGEQCGCPWMRIPDTCAACGKPATGFAMINDQRFCHPDQGPSCYMGGPQ